MSAVHPLDAQDAAGSPAQRSATQAATLARFWIVLALAATVLALTIAAVNVPPAGGKSDILKTYRPAETACNVG
jgi:hypothetical protein